MGVWGGDPGPESGAARGEGLASVSSSPALRARPLAATAAAAVLTGPGILLELASWLRESGVGPVDRAPGPGWVAAAPGS